MLTNLKKVRLPREHKSMLSRPRLVFGLQGAGTDDDVLIEILASRTGEEIKDIIKVYKKGESLSADDECVAVTDESAEYMLKFSLSTSNSLHSYRCNTYWVTGSS